MYYALIMHAVVTFSPIDVAILAWLRLIPLPGTNTHRL
nr:MAG TPA: hypothetical protein [Crassvirales sp.]